jgi:hypothetical protein
MAHIDALRGGIEGQRQAGHGPQMPQQRGAETMAIIFELKNLEPQVRDAYKRPAGATCEIILFPGVRYERWDVTPPPAVAEDAPGSHPRKRRAKKRVAVMAD